MRASRPQPPLELVVVASSTGGPNALAEFVCALPKDLACPILIVQHMPFVFTTMLAARLAKACKIPCEEAYEGATTRETKIWVAPGDAHLTVRARLGVGVFELGLGSGPKENGCRPAADVLFRSAVAPAEGGVLGVVLSGMGKDGLLGAEAIVAAGGRIVAQDPESSVVWSMPGAVVEAGLSDIARPPAELARLVGEAMRAAEHARRRSS